MVSKIQKRLAGEGGFTLIELLVVIVILGILVAIAVPSYLSFRGNAEQAAASSNVRSAIPAAEGFYQNNSTYSGMTVAGLTQVAPGVQVTHVEVSADDKAYCIDYVDGQHAAYYVGGDQGITAASDGFQTFSGTKSAVTGGSNTAAICSAVASG